MTNNYPSNSEHQKTFAKDHSKTLDEHSKTSLNNIHKVVEGEVVPTQAPSEIEQDIPPGITTQE